jgi:hypothetical protein
LIQEAKVDKVRMEQVKKIKMMIVQKDSKEVLKDLALCYHHHHQEEENLSS